MAKPTIVTRTSKGSALTWTEGDANLTNLKDATISIQAGTGGTTVVSDLNGTVTLVAGSNVTLTGDNTAKTVTIAASGGGELVNDTTPELGGDLDLKGFNITDSTTFPKLGGIRYPKITVSELPGTVTDVDSARTPNAIELSSTVSIVFGTRIRFSGTSLSGTGLTAGTDYYIVAGPFLGNYFEISNGPLGSPISISSPSNYTDFNYTAYGSTGTPNNGDILVYNGTNFAAQAPTSGGIASVSADANPSLGGNLNVNGNSIIANTGQDITLTTSGTGRVVISGQRFPAVIAGITGTVTAVDAVRTPNVLTLSNPTGINNGTSITFTGTGVTSIGLSIGTNYVINANIGGGQFEIALASGGGAISLTNPGTVTNVNYSAGGTTIPNNGDVLTYNSSGLVWAVASSGIVSVSEDTTPMLGGNLNLAGFSIENSLNQNTNITASGSGNIVLTPGATGRLVANKLNYNEAVHSLGSTSGTVAPDVANGNVQTITLNGNLTLNAFTNPIVGQRLTLIVNTGGTGRTLTSTMKFAGGNKTLSIINTTDIITVFYDGTNYWATLINDFNFKLLWSSWDGTQDGSILSFAFGGSRNAGRITDSLSLMVGRQNSSQSFARVLSLSEKSLSVSTGTEVPHIAGYTTAIAIVRINDTSAFVIEGEGLVYKIFNITSSGCSVSSNTVSITNSGPIRGGRVDATGKLILWNTRSGHAGRVTLDITGTTTITKNSETYLSYSSASTGIIQSLCILNDTEALAICGVSGAVKGFKLSSTATQIGTTYTSTLTNPTFNGQVTFQNLDKNYSIVFFMDGTQHRYFVLKETGFSNFLINPSTAFSGQLTSMNHPHFTAADDTTAVFSMINSSNIICHWAINVATSSVVYFNNTGNDNTDPYQNPVVRLNDTKIFANLSDGNRYKILSLD